MTTLAYVVAVAEVQRLAALVDLEQFARCPYCGGYEKYQGNPHDLAVEPTLYVEFHAPECALRDLLDFLEQS